MDEADYMYPDPSLFAFLDHRVPEVKRFGFSMT